MNGTSRPAGSPPQARSKRCPPYTLGLSRELNPRAEHGVEPTIRSFSMTHDIGAAAWPAALVFMAVLEVTARVLIVHARGLSTPEPASAVV